MSKEEETYLQETALHINVLGRKSTSASECWGVPTTSKQESNKIHVSEDVLNEFDYKEWPRVKGADLCGQGPRSKSLTRRHTRLFAWTSIGARWCYSNSESLARWASSHCKVCRWSFTTPMNHQAFVLTFCVAAHLNFPKSSSPRNPQIFRDDRLSPVGKSDKARKRMDSNRNNAELLGDWYWSFE